MRRERGSRSQGIQEENKGACTGLGWGGGGERGEEREREEDEGRTKRWRVREGMGEKIWGGSEGGSIDNVYVVLVVAASFSPRWEKQRCTEELMAVNGD